MFDLFGHSSSFSADDAARLRRVERKLDLILAHLGIPYQQGDGELPDSARKLADQGEKIAAIKVYREETGTGLAEAKRAIKSYLGRSPFRR